MARPRGSSLRESACQWGCPALTMAASLFALLPAVLIFAFGQKYLEQGILAGAVKG